MGYQRLTPEQEEQVKSMSVDGKHPEAISAFFKSTYKIKLPLWKISYIRGKHSAEDSPRKKSSPKKHAVISEQPAGGGDGQYQATGGSATR